MAGRRPVRTVRCMPYVHISDVPSITLSDYQKTVDHMGGDALLGDGHLVHLVGEVGSGLQIIDVWESKADADRFAAEHLFPAFAATGVHPTEHREVEFDTAVSRIGA